MTETGSPDCAPAPCPDCGGLVCLCRPRFFAGQLLTDEDLQRLDRYIVEKNKLHNRSLVGWGVVCGMEVVCNACDGLVTVKPGYALSPCGEDIVICGDAPVDICALIQKCRQKQPRECQPTLPGGADPCSSSTEEWVLSVHYDEKPSRGVVPLKNSGEAACCSTCACGGSGSCGCRGSSGGGRCSCGRHKSGNGNGSGCGCASGSTQSSRRSASVQAQCEPTVVCESYRFQICKVQQKLRPTPTRGALVDRYLKCIAKLQGLISAPPTSNNAQEVQNWCCLIRDNLLDLFADHPGYNCTIPQRLAVMCQAGANVDTVKLEVAFVLAHYIKDCFCGAFLPPCPCPVEDASVPLATITVSKANGVCRILSICNLDVRKFATTLPNIAYWLSFLPAMRNFRTALSRICCRPLVRRQVVLGGRVDLGRSPSPQSAAVDETEPALGDFLESHEFANVFAQAFTRGTNVVDVQTLALAVLGLTDANNQPFLTAIEAGHPLETLLANQLGRPFLEAIVPDNVKRVVEAFGAPPPPAEEVPQPETDVAAQLAELKAQVDAMAEELKASREQIDKLSKKKK